MRVQIVSFRCVLKNKLGQFISSSFNQDVVTTPDENSSPMLPEFVEALRLLKQGDRQKISISADRAYGFYKPELVIEVPRKKLKNGSRLKAGDTIHGRLDHDQVLRSYRVNACTSEKVTLDANHPLAGQDLVFDVEMVSSHEELDSTPASEFTGRHARLLC